MSSEKIIVVIDIGSSSMRSVLFGIDGNIRHIFQERYQMIIDGPRAVQEVSDFEKTLVSLAAQASAFAASCRLEIAAIALTSQRSSLIALRDDAGTGSLTPEKYAMMWYDSRPSAICDELNSRCGDLIYRTSGSLASPALLAPKIAWQKANDAEWSNGVRYYLTILDYMIYYICGAVVTDPTIACRSGLMDISTGKWSDVLLELYHIEREKLPEIVPCGSTPGNVSDAFAGLTGLPAGTPVITAGGDQQASVTGLGLREGDVGVTLGSGSYIVKKIAANDTATISHGRSLSISGDASEKSDEQNRFCSSEANPIIINNENSQYQNQICSSGTNSINIIPETHDYQNQVCSSENNSTNTSPEKHDYKNQICSSETPGIYNIESSIAHSGTLLNDIRIRFGTDKLSFQEFWKIIEDFDASIVYKKCSDDTAGVVPGVNLPGVNLPGVNLSDINLSDIDLTDISLSDINLSDIKGKPELAWKCVMKLLTEISERIISIAGPDFSNDIIISGGMASDFVCQTLSDMTNFILLKEYSEQSTAIGAWKIAMKSMNFVPDLEEADKLLCRRRQAYKPQIRRIL